jgi:hypothetical protein
MNQDQWRTSTHSFVRQPTHAFNVPLNNLPERADPSTDKGHALQDRCRTVDRAIGILAFSGLRIQTTPNK